MDLLQYGFFQHALLGSLLTAIACGIVGNALLVCLVEYGTQHAHIGGDGIVAQALVPILTSVDFSCVILENREEFCRPELFPGAEDVRMIENWHLGDYVSIGEEDYVCVMTRGHKDDTIVQEQILRTPAAYIGVIGSRRKKASVFRVLKEDGFTDRDLERITTPIGLEIGAETPAEIAISIAAQMIEVRAKVRK